MPLFADGCAAVGQALQTFQEASKAKITELAKLHPWGIQHAQRSQEGQASEVVATCLNSVQVEFEVKFHGVIPARQRRQVYEMTFYVFLPSGAELREMDRPFANIRTSAILHTPKVALSHLSTQFAPIMLQGQFNTTLQGVRNKLKGGKDAGQQMAQILQQLYLQAALYETALRQEAHSLARQMRHQDKHAGCMDEIARSVTLSIKRIVEAIQRLQQMCSECDNVGEVCETWSRVHEHVLLTAEEVLLDLLQCFDQHLHDQGVELQRSASTSAMPTAKSLPGARNLRRASSDKSLSARLDSEAPPPATLRELLLRLAGAGQASAAADARHPHSPKPGPKPKEQAAAILTSRPSATGSALAEASEPGAKDRLLLGKSSRMLTLLDVRKAEQEGGSATLGLDPVLQEPEPTSRSFKSITLPVSPFTYAGDSSSKHDAIAAAAAKTITSIKSALQMPYSGHEETPPDGPAAQTAAQPAQKFKRSSSQAWKPLPAAAQAVEAEEQPPNPFQQAAGGIPASRRLDRTREVLSMPSSRNTPEVPAAARTCGSWAPSQATQSPGRGGRANGLRSRLGEALLRRESENNSEDNPEPSRTPPPEPSRTPPPGIASQASVSTFDRKLELSKVFQALPKPMVKSQLWAARQSGLNEESVSQPLPVKLSGSTSAATSASSASLPEELGQPITSTPVSHHPQQPGRSAFAAQPQLSTTAAFSAQPAAGGSSSEAAKARPMKPVIVSPFAAPDNAPPWEMPSLPKTSSNPDMKAGQELTEAGSTTATSSSFNASVPVFTTGSNGLEALELAMESQRKLAFSQSLQGQASTSASSAEEVVNASNVGRRLAFSQSMQERGSSSANLSKGAKDLLQVVMKDYRDSGTAGPSADPSPQNSGALHPAPAQPVDPEPATAPADDSARATVPEPPAPQGPPPLPEASVFGRSMSIVRGPVDQAEQLRRFAFQKTQTRKAIQYSPPPELAGMPQQSDTESETESSEEGTGSDSSPERIEWKDAASVVARLRTAKQQEAALQAQDKAGSEKKGFKSKLSLLRAFKSSRLATTPSGNVYFTGLAKNSANSSVVSHEALLDAAEKGDGEEDEASPELEPELTAAQPAAAYLAYVKPKLFTSRGKLNTPSHRHGDEPAELGVVPRTDSVGSVMYVHTPTPGPAEDVVRPLPDRVSSTFRRTWRHLSSSDFLGGHAAKIERQQLARGSASSLEALHEMPAGPHGELEATADLEKGRDSDDLIAHVGPQEKQNDKAIDAVLRQIAKPKAHLRSGQAVTLNKTRHQADPNALAAFVRMSSKNRTTDVDQRIASRFWGRIGSHHMDEDGPNEAEVDPEERLRQLKRDRLRALRAAHRRIGARFEMRRWGVAFQTSSGLPGVLRKARLLQLRQAEHPEAADGPPDRLRAKALLKQTRALLCTAAEGMQEERRHFGFHDTLPDSDPDALASRVALVGRTAAQATSLANKAVNPRPAAGDVFVWLCGIVAIVFCAFAIDLANNPLRVTKAEYENAILTQRDLSLPNTERALATSFLAVAIMAVWVYILRDRWVHYKQSLDLLGVVPTRKSIITDHSGKGVGKSLETCRQTRDNHLREQVLSVRHSLKGYVPSLGHPDRPEHVFIYERVVKLSWDLLDARMQTVDGINFKARLDLTPILAALDSKLVAHRKLAGQAKHRRIVQQAANAVTHELYCVVSLRRHTDEMIAIKQPDLHKLKLVAQQGSVTAVKPINMATEAAEEVTLRRRRHAASSDSNTQDAVAAFTQLVDQAASREQKHQLMFQGW